ncbi:sialidase family protein [Fundidesulfovibrio soli]|uniref:sialidase family protein n=1 Tax=Fundidesulfovibrio soli TaxID=2922716 RepID=UPI001FAF7CDA|nr:sialidase family protein [Fundidesulfovibrio soli]
MPSIASDTGRHVTIDRRPGQYLSFPDVCLTDAGTLVCVYRQGDQHVATRFDLLNCTSHDLGRTWTKPRYLVPGVGHCPRMTRLPGGKLMIIDDQSQSTFVSMDDGAIFLRQSCAGSYIPIPDRVLPLRPDLYLTTGHTHQGESAPPKIRQAPSMQMVYASRNQGGAWQPYSVMVFDPNLVLCEASMTRLEDGRLLAILRENSFVHEPMYICTSDDEGVSWTPPRPTPLIGHRPCIGLTPSGRLLVTYRNVAPDGGTAAWMGSLEELDTDYAVHGLHPDTDNPRPTPQGLLVENEAGRESCLRYCLRPMTDPERARATLSAEVLVESAQQNACALYFCGWWRLTPEALLPPAPDAAPTALERGKPVRLTLRHSPGEVRAEVNGEHAGTYPVDSRRAEARPILVGNANTREHNGGRHFWRSLSLSVTEPRYERDYTWSWEHTQGHPDAWAQARVLEMANDREANFGDYGYSGWTALPDGRYFCAYHHAASAEPGYEPGRSCHIRGTWLEDSDFTPQPPREGP